MPVTERLQALGQWSLTLKPDTPKTVRDAINVPFSHVLITPSHVLGVEGLKSPGSGVTGIADAYIQDMAIYNGVVLRPGPQFEIGGVGILWWLGDDRGVPRLLSPVSSGTGASPITTWASGLVINTPISIGSVTGGGPVGGSIGASFTNQSPRVALEAIFKYFRVEYRMNPDYTLDYGEPADLYGTDAVATALTAGQGGREGGIKGFRVDRLDYNRDFSDLLSRVTASGRGGSTDVVAVNILTEYGASAPDGNPVVRWGFFDVPEAALGFETNYATSIADRYSDVDVVGIQTDDYVRGTFGPGYYINVYDPDRGLLDEDNQDFYQGEVVFPKKVRVIGMTWPIQQGLGVYHRFKANGITGDVTYTDLTPYIEWERPGTRIEVGNVAYSPIADQFSVSAQTAGVNAAGWDTYTPTITGTGTSVGNGTVVGKWRRSGTTMHLDIRWTLGSTSTIGAGGVTFSLPSGITAATQTNRFQKVEGHAFDSSAGASADAFGYVASGATTVVMQTRAYNGAAAGVAYVSWAGVSATVPFTWATSDALGCNGTLEVAP